MEPGLIYRDRRLLGAVRPVGLEGCVVLLDPPILIASLKWSPLCDLPVFLGYSRHIPRMLSSGLLAGFIFELSSTFHVQPWSACGLHATGETKEGLHC